MPDLRNAKCAQKDCIKISNRIKKRVLKVWRGFRSFAWASTLGHALGRGGLHHLLVFADQLGQVVGDGHVQPSDGAAAEVGARGRQLLELVQRVETEEVSVRLRVR